MMASALHTKEFQGWMFRSSRSMQPTTYCICPLKLTIEVAAVVSDIGRRSWRLEIRRMREQSEVHKTH